MNKSFFKSIDFRNLDYRHYILSVLFLGVCVLVGVKYYLAFPRLYESIRDLVVGLIRYFCSIFEIETEIGDEIKRFSEYIPVIDFPETWEKFKAAFSVFWGLTFSKNNFNAYLLYLKSDVFRTIYVIILIILPLAVFFVLFVSRLFNEKNNDYDVDSRPLVWYKAVDLHVILPVKRWFASFFAFARDNSFYLYGSLILLALGYNLISIVISFFAVLFYFIATFDFETLYISFVKLLSDLAPMFENVPKPVLIVIGFVVFDKIRKNIGYRILRHNEMRNRGFINERPIVFMLVGSMGKKKTTLVTDMCLSQEVMLRDKALELLIKNDLKFPRFPWILFENALKEALRKHRIYNLATCKRYVRLLAFCFDKSRTASEKSLSFLKYHYEKYFGFYYENYLFGYDFNTYGLYYNDNLTENYIWDVLETYSQLYFIYVCQSSLILSNYSVRTDNIFQYEGNFPIWNTDFFHRDPTALESLSRHSHILDFDALRLGKKVVEENKLANSFEFGVIAITEIGKERGNNLELNDIKKAAPTANQKNDLFNSWLKMVRHSATVDNFPFVRVIVDEQRPESWGADARDLCQIVHIDSCSDNVLAMPFFALGELFYAFVSNRFENSYVKYRFNRGDNTLTMHGIKGFSAGAYHLYERIYNLFGFRCVKLAVEDGTQNGDLKPAKYFLANKKIYSRRFSTDCFSDIFNAKSLASAYGLDDIPEFETERATVSEMQSENSYFFNDLCRVFSDYKIIN